MILTEERTLREHKYKECFRKNFRFNNFLEDGFLVAGDRLYYSFYQKCTIRHFFKNFEILRRPSAAPPTESTVLKLLKEKYPFGETIPLS